MERGEGGTRSEKEPYAIEPHTPPCERCGTGGAYVIAGPGDVTWGVVFDSAEEAEETCRLLNRAHARGFTEGGRAPRFELADLVEAAQDVVQAYGPGEYPVRRLRISAEHAAELLAKGA